MSNNNNLYVIHRRRAAKPILDNFIKRFKLGISNVDLSRKLGEVFTSAVNNINLTNTSDKTASQLANEFRNKIRKSGPMVNAIFNTYSKTTNKTNNLLNKYALLATIKIAGSSKTGVSQSEINNFVNDYM